MASAALRRIHRAYADDAGPVTISGVVRKLTTPVSVPVYLLNQLGLRVIRETRSASNGAYSFANIAAGAQYVVLSVDPDGAYNAVLADRVQT